VSSRLVTFEWYAHSTVYLTACLGFGLGSGIVLGGERRFSNAGLATARLVPGSHYTWGMALMILGVVIAVGIGLGWKEAWITSGFIGSAAWYAFFALSVLVSAAKNPDVAVTGVFAYGALAVLCVCGWACGQGLRE
jgi:hypothetical protein